MAGHGILLSSHAWIGFCALKENRVEGQLPSDRDMALIALRAGQHVRQIAEHGATFDQIRVEFEKIQNLQRNDERQAVQANLRLSAASAVVHHEVSVSRAEVQSARGEVVEVMQFADQRFEEAKQQIAQELRAQAYPNSELRWRNEIGYEINKQNKSS